MKEIRLGIIATLMSVLAVFSSQADASTVLYYTSSEDSWVGLGETVTVVPDGEFSFTAYRNYDNGITFRINNFSAIPMPDVLRSWYLDFAAPYKANLQPGHYADATRFPFQEESEPGLNFSGNGHGNNTLLGYFDVYEVAYGTGDAILSFAADFVQYDEGFEDAWNKGSIRYNSDYPIPEPSTLALLLTGLPLLGIIAKLNR